MPTFSELKLIFALVALAAAFAGGFVLEHRLASAKYSALELSYAQAQAKAVAAAQAKQAQLDAIAAEAATQEARHQEAIASATAAQLREVKRHVKADSHCVSWGLVRVLDAAVYGVNADRLVLPAGKLDDTCAPFNSDELARAVVKNYGTARANADQLNSLIAALRAAHKK